MGKTEYSLTTFWFGDESSVLLNPQTADQVRENIVERVREFPRPQTLWLQSSGTESQRGAEHKVVALAKAGFLAAAQSVNRHFALTQQDAWLNCLPTFHVGGLAIYARAMLADSPVVELPGTWCPQNFCAAIAQQQISLTSMVPTQVYDVVDENRRAPSSLRYVFVGGGALKPELYHQARHLGWPLIPSYGMTETSAMIAAAAPTSLASSEFPQLHLLPHVHATINEAGRLKIRSRAVADGVLHIGHDNFRWQPFNSEFISDDRISLTGDILQILGRESELVKILGETVNLQSLQEIAEDYFQKRGQFAVFVTENTRRGFDIYGAFEGQLDPNMLREFNRQVEPFKRIKNLLAVEKIPRNDLGKIQKSRLTAMIESHLGDIL